MKCPKCYGEKITPILRAAWRVGWYKDDRRYLTLADYRCECGHQWRQMATIEMPITTDPVVILDALLEQGT